MKLNKADLSAFLAEARKTHAANYFYFNYFQQIEKNLWNNLIDVFLNNKANYYYCSQPNKDFSFLAYDELVSITENNTGDYSLIQESFNRIQSKFVSNAAKFDLVQNPLLLGMTKFPSAQRDEWWTDFSDSKWIVPKFLILQKGDRYFFGINAVYYDNIEDYLENALNDFTDDILSPSELKDISYSLTESKFEDWSMKINYALKNITDRTVEKIVLARFIDLELSERPLMHIMLKRLEEQNKDCYTFACKSDKSIFFGSTPEKLFSVNNGILQTEALAGSFPRGESESIDLMLQDQLLHDRKNLFEHNAVTMFLKDQLSEISTELEIEKNPVVRKLSNIQHLYTPIRAKIKEGVSIFKVFEKLYPTPAVCGIPPRKSKELIEEIENFERGLYAGAIGWIGFDNTSEIYVSIRSAILKEKHIRAFAGGGIVEGSNSREEFNETNLKLKPILSLFINENSSQS